MNPVPVEEDDVCMMCCKSDRIVASETSNDGWMDDGKEDFWVYCDRCDCWTSHPMERGETDVPHNQVPVHS